MLRTASIASIQIEMENVRKLRLKYREFNYTFILHTRRMASGAQK